MVEAVNETADQPLQFCKGCFEGVYPTGDITPEMLRDIEVDRIAASTT